MQNPFVTANRSWLKKGKKQLLREASSLSEPVAITVIGIKNISRAKKMKIKEYLLNAPFRSAEYLPTVSPMLQNRRRITTDQLVQRLSKDLSKDGPGNRVNVITKVNIMIHGQGQICLLVSINVLKQFCPSILFSSLASFSSTGSVRTVSFYSPSVKPISRLSLLSRRGFYSIFTKNLSILCLQTWDLQNEIFISRSAVLKIMAITKQVMMGATALLSTPKIARIIILITVINNPDTAVPTVNLETTS